MLAPSQVSVVLLGETGIGKELCARLGHRLIGLTSEREIVIELNQATQHWHTGNTRKRAISVRPGHRVYESHVDRFRLVRPAKNLPPLIKSRECSACHRYTNFHLY
jgi:hypothetical protein